MNYNALKDKRQIKCHPLFKKFALSLKYASSAPYRQVTKLGLALPWRGCFEITLTGAPQPMENRLL